MNAVEQIAARGPRRFCLTCEHASAELPPPWRWSAEDGWVVSTHWAYDLSAAVLVRELAAASGVAAVLARFSRLFVDPNRPLSSDELMRTEAEGRSIALNRSIDAMERERRLAYWRAYHDAVDAMVGGSDTPVVLAVHSFTPVYQGDTREVEIGVLFDEDEQAARQLAHALGSVSRHVRLNEPYSGRQGLIYSADRHARAHERAALELELRQDLLSDAGFRERLVAALLQALS